MKKAILLLLTLIPLATMAQVNRSDTLLSLLRDGGRSDYVMIFAHRGDWRHAPENSLKAYQKCIDEGIDGIEVDVQCTKDSVLVVMHDNTIDRTTTGSGKVSDYTLDELGQFFLKSPIGVVTRQRIPTFDEVLQLAKGKILIQVDKWPSVKRLVLEAAKRHDCLDQLIFRTSRNSKYVLKEYSDVLRTANYIPVLVCNGHNDEEKLEDFISNLPVTCIGFSFKRDDYPVLDRVNELKSNGVRIWFNSLWADFNGGHDDELATFDEEASYGWLLEKGANVIFSDHPVLLKKYLEKKGLRTIKH